MTDVLTRTLSNFRTSPYLKARQFLEKLDPEELKKMDVKEFMNKYINYLDRESKEELGNLTLIMVKE